MTAEKKVGSGGIMWRWWDVVEERVVSSGLKPHEKRNVLLVAWRRGRFADPFGGNCFPSQKTIAHRTMIDEDAVRVADRWLVDQGLMRRGARVGIGGSYSYVLTLPGDEVGDKPLPPSPEVPPREGVLNDSDAPKSPRERGNFRRSKVSKSPRERGYFDEVTPEVTPEVTLSEGYNLLDLPNEVREGGGGNGATPAGTPTASDDVPPSSSKMSDLDARRFIADAKFPAPLDAAHTESQIDDLLGEIGRIVDLGYTPGQYRVEIGGLPSKSKINKRPVDLLYFRTKRITTPPNPDLDNVAPGNERERLVDELTRDLLDEVGDSRIVETVGRALDMPNAYRSDLVKHHTNRADTDPTVRHRDSYQTSREAFVRLMSSATAKIGAPKLRSVLDELRAGGFDPALADALLGEIADALLDLSDSHVADAYLRQCFPDGSVFRMSARYEGRDRDGLVSEMRSESRHVIAASGLREILDDLLSSSRLPGEVAPLPPGTEPTVAVTPRTEPDGPETPDDRPRSVLGDVSDDLVRLAEIAAARRVQSTPTTTTPEVTQ